MTSIFAYPLKNAWVLASDKLETNQSESLRIAKGFETFPSDVITKVKTRGNHVYGIAGLSHDIEKIEGLLTNNIKKTLNFLSFRQGIISLYGDNIKDLDVELLLIDSKKVNAYKIIIKNLPDKLSEAKINSIENGFIGSGSTKNRSKFQIIPIFDSVQDLEIKRSGSKSLNELLKKTVFALEILARNDYQFTGHPAIYGCNILVINKTRILNYKVLPKRYIFKEGQQTNWSNLEELEDA